MGQETPEVRGGMIDSQSSCNALKATVEMCLYCFDVLLKYILKEKMALHDVDHLHTLSSDITCPLFVTWDILRRNPKSKAIGLMDSVKDGEDNETYILRGCIGSLSPQILKSSLGEYALASAVRDRRFQAIMQNEVPLLRVAVSLLIQYEECNHVFDWEVGTHGIILKFSHNDLDYSATYLPEVAFEQGWTQERTVESLVRKAGFLGVISVDLLSEIKCTRYQSSKHKLAYSDYIATLGYDPIHSLSANTGTSSSSRRNRSWKDVFHL